MNVFLYSAQSNEQLAQGRSALEDDLDDFLKDAGQVTGGGSGDLGWNVDLEVVVDDLEPLLERLVGFLRGWPVPPDAYMMIGERRLDVFPK